MSRLNPRDSSKDLQIANLECRLESVEAGMWRNSQVEPISVDNELVNEDIAEQSLAVPTGAVLPATPRPLKAEPMAETVVPQPEERFPLPHKGLISHYKVYYFDILNSGMPIFDHQPYMYGDLAPGRDKDDEIYWAATNAVVALAMRHKPGKSTATEKLESTCIKNIESVLGTIMSREPELLTVQVILCLAWYYMATEDFRPASPLIGAAVKMAYSLKLHLYTKNKFQRFGTDQWERVFWITYILDRDLSLLTHEPYLIHDDHIGIDIKDMSTSRDLGNVGHSHNEIEVLRRRAELATIKGKLYELVYSVKASNFTPGKKQAAEERVFRMLANWKKYIDEPSHPDSVWNSTRMGQARHKHESILHLDYYHCLFSVVKASIHNDEWRRKLTLFSETYNRGDDTRFITMTSPLLPCNWAELIEAARFCHSEVLTFIPEGDDALRCISMPTFEGCLTVLSAHIISLPERDLTEPTLDSPCVNEKQRCEYDEVDHDESRISDCERIVGGRIRRTDNPSVLSDLKLCKELLRTADKTLSRFWEKAPKSFWDAREDGLNEGAETPSP
ncbi:hypothetical protein NW752_009581 [Fusarium irregulare]|uniref:Xylanolytic transcriptional activator regulatory domain-containing protein n=1 Tax=Fusarium irregulare TaxID=2494466 RepID=A0A9W8PF52_9HYPO|nr:hypothetical protein NW766_011488 [Fusarium irregulare]KAJ4009282.1 hypothetical protein NW752_009581 [Fusarium irregulare]